MFYLRAINKRGELQALGIELSKFPLEPTYAKALLTSHYLDCDDEMMTLVSVLSSENVWMTVSRRKDEEQQKRLEDVRKHFIMKTDQKSDHMVLVKIYDEWERQGPSHQNDWCYRNFVQNRALKQAFNIRAQLQDHMRTVEWSRLEKSVEDFACLK